ncbi:hypothetical protein GUITHDRAFT_137477 [Guillardia theta CCMP2712]|uniref:Uncharacterized protein n=1 Tax=Guillardia theta (strain CCMP2712) TaxID=905079 RepID=L1JFN0_GUITC|nr:hypothetical protein GUITHDRAFT_137477 [Guillardia theta CCMP2712]EKX47286.1 hypothetical protein GUITHDRAFT_137477 [Guillardia theta CCMP2712]|eukprot:XP_005834266.1 hypothetical protein GUITHDRAFT_137477 [Guillardia theta CCMP2712]
MKLPPPPQPSASKVAPSKDLDEIEEVEDDNSSEASSENEKLAKTSKKDQDEVQPRERSLSFDDLYQLAPLQDGLSLQSAFAFEPLEGDETKAFRRSASLDGIYALAEAMIRESEDRSQKKQQQSCLSQLVAVGNPLHRGPRSLWRIMGLVNLHGEDGNEMGEEYEIESVSTAEEDDSPAERLFGKERANELRKRITKSKKVSPQAAREALDAATAETIEFVTWFSVWILIIFWLLFYSSYGPTLWRFLYGPMGLVLVLPFGFGLLFWLVTYVFTEEED